MDIHLDLLGKVLLISIFQEEIITFLFCPVCLLRIHLYVINFDLHLFQIDEMDMEMRKAPSPYRNQLMTKVRAYRKEMETAKRDLVRYYFFVVVDER